MINRGPPPPNIDTISDLFTQPTILMIDELLHLLLESESRKIGNTTLADMTITFFMKLLSAVSSSNNSKILYTISENTQIYEDQMRKIRTLDQDRAEYMILKLHSAQARQARSVAPVGSNEIYDVVRKRLVVEIDNKEKEYTVSKYLEYYESKGVETDRNYRQQMLAAYPFHPMLLKEILYERVSTIPSFNRTRGILRLMSLVSHNIIKNKTPCSIIGPAHVDLEDRDILNEITTKLGQASTFQPIIESDCISKANKLDMGSSFPLIVTMARIICLYSLIGAKTKSGIRLNKMKLAVARPTIDLGLIEEGFHTISEEFWYISDNNGYYFDQEPNINKIIADFENEIQPLDTQTRIERVLTTLFAKIPGKINTLVWPTDIPECDILTLVILPPHEIKDEASFKQHVSTVLGFLPGGITVRKRKNTLIFLSSDNDLMRDVEKSAKHLLAIEKAQQHKPINKYEDKELHKKIMSKKSNAEGDLEADCRRAYNQLAYPMADFQNNPSIQFSLLHPNQSQTTIVEAIIQNLQNNGKLILELGEDGLRITKPSTPAQILDAFKNDRNSKMLMTQTSVLDAAISAVKSELFYPAMALHKKNGKYIVDLNTFVDWGTYLIPKSLAVQNPKCNLCKNILSYSDELNKFICTHCAQDDVHTCTVCNKKSPSLLKINTSYYCLRCMPRKHNYKIKCDTLQSLFESIQVLRVLNVGIVLEHTILSNLSSDYASLTLTSSTKNLTEIESFFKKLSEQFNGSSTILISSQSDLSEKFAGEGLRYEEMDPQS